MKPRPPVARLRPSLPPGPAHLLQGGLRGLHAASARGSRVLGRGTPAPHRANQGPDRRRRRRACRVRAPRRARRRAVGKGPARARAPARLRPEGHARAGRRGRLARAALGGSPDRHRLAVVLQGDRHRPHLRPRGRAPDRARHRVPVRRYRCVSRPRTRRPRPRSHDRGRPQADRGCRLVIRACTTEARGFRRHPGWRTRGAARGRRAGSASPSPRTRSTISWRASPGSDETRETSSS